MSKKLLSHLNGDRNGKFRQWLDGFEGEPRIAWYPSAGDDFRDLLYLHPKFSDVKPARKPEPASPDIFLHTDYFPWSTSTFLDSPLIHGDDHTSITVTSIEELPRCDLPLDAGIVDFPNGSRATGRVLFMEIAVKSDVLGSFSSPVVYAFVVNEAFYARRIIPNAGIMSHVVHIRYGGGCGGGGKASGIWLLNVLRKLKCECFITDGHYHRQPGDIRAYELYPELAGDEDQSQFETIRTLPSEGWSGHGDVSWNLMRR